MKKLTVLLAALAITFIFAAHIWAGAIVKGPTWSLDDRASQGKNGQIREYIGKNHKKKTGNFLLDLAKKTVKIGEEVRNFEPRGSKKPLPLKGDEAMVVLVERIPGQTKVFFSEGDPLVLEGECVKVYPLIKGIVIQWKFPKKGRGEAKKTMFCRAPWGS